MRKYQVGLLCIWMSLCILTGCSTNNAEESESKMEREPISSEQTDITEERIESAEAPAISHEESAQPESVQSKKTLHVQGSQLMNANNEPVQLRGISTHGLAWFPEYVNEACFQQLKDEWNVNVVRLAMYTAEYGG